METQRQANHRRREVVNTNEIEKNWALALNKALTSYIDTNDSASLLQVFEAYNRWRISCPMPYPEALAPREITPEMEMVAELIVEKMRENS